MKYILLLITSINALSLWAQGPAVLCGGPSTNQICSYENNDLQLWSNWTDLLNQTNNLSETDVVMEMTCTDPVYGPSDLTVQALVFLDLDGNGAWETVVNSADLPPAGQVYFDNSANPGYLGGTPVAFHDAPAPTSDLYQFQLLETISGNTKSCKVVWNTANNPTLNKTPKLPLGNQKVKWIVLNPNADQAVCEDVFMIRDCKKPTIVCNNGLAVNIMQTGMVAMWASDFLQYSEDNTTPTANLKYGIRKAGTGAGFPVDDTPVDPPSLEFSCLELGVNTVELWVQDAQGNADYCETAIMVNDALGVCGNFFDVTVCPSTCCDNQPIENVDVYLTPGNTHNPATLPTNSGDNACLETQLFFASGATYTVACSKNDNPVNGVSTYDMLLISKHILGVQPFTSPCSYVAADVNQSGTVTAFDMVEIRKLILGIYQQFPFSPSWKFFDANYPPPTPGFPPLPAFESTVTITDPLDYPDGVPFIGIKTGDLNCTALTHNFAPQTADDRAIEFVKTENTALTAGETALLPFYFEEVQTLAGFQLELALNNRLIQLEEVIPGTIKDMAADNFGQSAPDRLAVSWSTIDGQGAHVQAPVFYLRVRALADVQVADALRLDTGRIPAESYTETRANGALQLAFERSSFDVGVRVWPNPTQTLAHLAFKENATALTVTDMLGKIVFTKDLSTDKTNVIDIPAEALHTPGTYAWKLESEGKVESGLLVKL